jgi:hypothetical protein
MHLVLLILLLGALPSAILFFRIGRTIGYEDALATQKELEPINIIAGCVFPDPGDPNWMHATSLLVDSRYSKALPFVCGKHSRIVWDLSDAAELQYTTNDTFDAGFTRIYGGERIKRYVDAIRNSQSERLSTQLLLEC